MTDKDDFLAGSHRHARLRADGLALMTKGAFYAFLFCLAVGLLFWVLIGISGLLPEDSKMRPDPTPLSHLMLVEPAVQAA